MIMMRIQTAESPCLCEDGEQNQYVEQNKVGQEEQFCLWCGTEESCENNAAVEIQNACQGRVAGLCSRPLSLSPVSSGIETSLGIWPVHSVVYQ